MNRLLVAIFLLSLFLRFLYFPNNIYFGFDQARDAYAVSDILNGDLKIVGPPTSVEGLYHGVFYYYILAPIYFFGKGNIEVVAASMRIFNALGVFLIFYIGSVLFNKTTGLLAALFFSFSFEQTQFSIYMGNPALAVLSILLMYLGLALVIFRNKRLGLSLAALGFGFSVQFQFALLYLTIPFFLTLIIFRKKFLNLSFKTWIFSGVCLLLSTFTFILAEIKYDFRTINTLTSSFGSDSGRILENMFSTYKFNLSRMGQYNIVGEFIFGGLILAVSFIIFLFFLRKKETYYQMIFLGIWFFSIISTIIVSGGVADVQKNVPLYYPNVGVSVALLLFLSFLISKIFARSKITAILMVVLVIYANLHLIQSFNPKGTISEINVQQGMLLASEKQAVDYIYNESGGKPFAVKGVTMPFFINTTWSYLFEWYGKNKYGYLPVWNGKNAIGYPGNLTIQEAQERLPVKRFLVVEPLRGITPYLVDEYLKEENYFTKVVEEKEFGKFVVQKREKF